MKKQKSKIAVYPGTFDPLTYGHLDIIKRASGLFDEVVVAVAENSSKNTVFTAAERVKMIQNSAADIKNVEVESFRGLLVSYAKEKGALAVVRGLRTISDFDYEFQMALTNKQLYPKIETVFLMPSVSHIYISSTLVKEIAKNGKNVSAFVPTAVAKQLGRKFRS